MLKANDAARVLRVIAAFIRGAIGHAAPVKPFYNCHRQMLAHHWGCYVGEQVMKYIIPILTGFICLLTVGCEIAFRMGYLN